MIYTHLAAAVIAALAAWFFQDNRYTAELAEADKLSDGLTWSVLPWRGD